MTTSDSGDPLAALLAAMQLDVGIVWRCDSCPMQGRYVHQSIDAARHDAAGHAIGHHRDRVALASIALRLIGEEERVVRLRSAWDGTIRVVPPLEPDDAQPLSPLQLDLVCDAIGCPPDSRHRRRRRESAAAGAPWG